MGYRSTFQGIIFQGEVTSKEKLSTCGGLGEGAGEDGGQEGDWWIGLCSFIYQSIIQMLKCFIVMTNTRDLNMSMKVFSPL